MPLAGKFKPLAAEWVKGNLAFMIPFSVLDTTPVLQGSDATQAFRNTLDLAQHAERWGYVRYWLAEHHNMPGIASAATSVVIGHRSDVRSGSGSKRDRK